MFPPSTVNVQNRLQWWNNWGIITIVLGESNPSEVGMRYWEGQKQSFQCKHFPKCCPSPHTRKWQNILGFGMVTVGIHPNRFKVFNVHPNGIPTKKNIETCSVKLPALYSLLLALDSARFEFTLKMRLNRKMLETHNICYIFGKLSVQGCQIWNSHVSIPFNLAPAHLTRPQAR